MIAKTNNDMYTRTIRTYSRNQTKQKNAGFPKNVPLLYALQSRNDTRMFVRDGNKQKNWKKQVEHDYKLKTKSQVSYLRNNIIQET